MKINSISFNGAYKENITEGYKDRIVLKELKRAKPFLKLLANNMEEDIFVKVDNDPCDTILSIDCINKKTNKAFNLATRNEHTLTGSGCCIMEDTFKGLEKYDKKAFDYAAKGFVKQLSRIDDMFTSKRLRIIDDKYIVLDCGCVMERKK